MTDIKNDPIVYVAFQVIPRSNGKNNFELVDMAIEVVKNAQIP